MKNHKYLILFIFFICTLFNASARAGVAAQATLDARVQKLAEELRCLVCQNQSLADSHADLAIDLKNQIREQLTRGASEEQVVAFMTERYGDFVLYRPPFKGTTLLLWLGPVLLMVAGLIALFVRLRRRAAAATAPALSAEARARAAALLEGADPGAGSQSR
jgi:cytochrome c-type biogenesis protein CcmH